MFIDITWDMVFCNELYCKEVYTQLLVSSRCDVTTFAFIKSLQVKDLHT